jgi:hypothetical protein
MGSRWEILKKMKRFGRKEESLERRDGLWDFSDGVLLVMCDFFDFFLTVIWEVFSEFCCCIHITFFSFF